MDIIIRVKNLIFEDLTIRITSVCFLLSVVCSLLYASWIEAGRFFNAQTMILNQVQKKHGVRLKINGTAVVEKGILVAEKGEVSLGSHGAGIWEDIRIENHQIFIKNAQFQVFDDNPWLWVSGLCVDGEQIQIKMEKLTVKTALGKTYSLGKFEIMSNGYNCIKGVCEKFSVEHWGESAYAVEGDLTALHAAFENSLIVDFIRFLPAKKCREVNGRGTVSAQITLINSLVFRISQPLTVEYSWQGKEVKGILQTEDFGLEMTLTPDLVSLNGQGKSKGFDWHGQINSTEEQYQLFIDRSSLPEVFKNGSFSEKYSIPENWLKNINGICEIKRDVKRGRIQLIVEPEGKRLTLEEIVK